MGRHHIRPAPGQEYAMFTTGFWLATAERAVKTFAQTLLALFLAGGQVLNLVEFEILPALGLAGGAAAVSILTSLLSLGVGPAGSPSMVGEPS